MIARLIFLLALLCAACLPARADTPLTVFQNFSGTINVIGTQATLRNDNKDACNVTAVGTNVTATLSGLPAGAVVKSAQLYWAGSGNVPDYTVNFDGSDVNAAANRRYTSSTDVAGYNYFSGAADVTDQVAKKGNGNYKFSGLSVDNGKPWCGVEGVLGGFALLVVYAAPGEPFRALNLYEGFQYFRNNSMTVNLKDFVVPPSAPAGRVGYLTWLGDKAVQGSEGLAVNNVTLADASSPAPGPGPGTPPGASGNVFNSASNVNADTASYGIDFDLYTLPAGAVKAGDTTATATYQTGADMVLLGVEILALPYTPNADLALSMTRSGDLAVGSTASYLLNVTNNGPDTETGPVTVVDTLPAGMKLAGSGGAGWTCNSMSGSGGTTVVTCTQAGPVAAGSSMTTLTLSVTPTTTGNLTNSAKVSGNTGEKNLANNAASDTGGATSTAVYSFMGVFTRDVCMPGQQVVFTNDTAAGVCHAFSGPITAAKQETIYLTATTISNGVQYATALSGSDMDVPLSIRATCLPFSGVAVSYANTTLDCKGGWVNISVNVKGGAATTTSVGPFVYADVGRVVLSLRYESSMLANLVLVSRPVDLRMAVKRGSYVDPYGVGGNGAWGPWGRPDIGFTSAGAPFTAQLTALMANGSAAPSFGKEPAALGSVMGTANPKFGLDVFTASLQTSPPTPLADKDGVAQNAFLVNQDWAPFTDAGASGYQATLSWFEAGFLALTPSLVDYLGTGPVGGLPAGTDKASSARFIAGTRVLGRFYPDHFVTEVSQNFDCPAALKCPMAFDAAKPAYPISGGTYAGQPFSLTVSPYGLARAGVAQRLDLFQAAASGTRALKLTAVTAPTDGAGAAPGVFQPSPAFLSTDAAGAVPKLSDDAATYTLPNPYKTGQLPPATWSAPQLFYLRAAMTETVEGMTAPTVTVSSAAPSSAAAGTQYEDGMMAVIGRLMVQNAFGSELLRLPVPVSAQYWNGSAWVVNTSFGDNSVAQDIGDLKNCTRMLAQTGTTTCKPNAVTAAYPGSTIALSKGVGKVILQAPVRAAGSVDYLVPGALGWLPSTRARATFGIFKSPVIYLREVY